MFYQLNRPFQAYPIYYDLPSSSLDSIFPLWFGPAWQTAPASLRASAKPLLALSEDEPTLLSHIQNFAYEQNTCRDPYFVFHGGAVTRGRDAYLFLATTTTGKTTLITYLTMLGYTYLNDDCFYMDMDTLEVMPYSSPIHLREGGYTYLQSVLPEPLPACLYVDRPPISRYVFMPQNRMTQPTRPKRIFFLDRTDDPAVCDSCQPLPSFMALNKLFTSSLIPYRMSRQYIQFFQKLTPLCYQLTYHDAPYVAKLLTELDSQEVPHE